MRLPETNESNPLKQYERWLYAVDIHPSSGCVACGNCYGRGPANWLADEHNTADWKCVPFDYYGWRRYTPSAFWELATRYYHGRIGIDGDVQETLFSCAQCGLCNETCGIVQDGARLSDIFKAFRFAIYEKMGPFRGHAETIGNVKKHGNAYGVSGIPTSSWAQNLGVKIVKNRNTKTLLYVGDDAAYKLPNVAKSVARVLTKAGVDYGVLEDEVNSGYYLEVMGDRKGAEELWRKNAETFKKHGVKKVVCLDPHDYHVLRRELGSRFNILHITEFGSDLVSSRRIRPKSLRRKVTYHDPCYLARQAGSTSPRERRVIEEPRNILRAITGLELIEMQKRGKWTWCAGECGGVKQGFPELARWRAQRLIEEASATGAEVLVTAAPSEQQHITEVLEAEKSNLKCLDVMELVAEAIS